MAETHVLFSLQKDVIPVCEDVFEVRDYATTLFVFELGPQTNACVLARWGHHMWAYMYMVTYCVQLYV